MKLTSGRILGTLAGLALAIYLALSLFPKKPASVDEAPVVSSPPMPLADPKAPPASDPQVPAAPASKKPSESPLKVVTAPSPKIPVRIKAGQPIPELFPHQAERDRLVALASTYDAKNIPLIAPSLTHADSTVREAARQALSQMGDPAAIPFLEAASKVTRDPTEVEILREMIEFLSLPRFMDVVTLGANAAVPNP